MKSGDQIGDYVILEHLATGGMAEVYLVRGVNHHPARAALKILPPSLADNEDMRTLFTRETELAVCISHPAVVRTFALESDGEKIFSLMEYIDGIHLRKLWAAMKKAEVWIPTSSCLFIAMQAAQGLSAIHAAEDAAGLPLESVHRDLSPANWMLTNGNVKLIDFGISKSTVHIEQTVAGVLKGKFGYMSPEQARGERATQSSDLFVLGIVLAELLTQERLLVAEDAVKTLDKIAGFDFDSFARAHGDLPEVHLELLSKFLANDPAKRFSSAQAAANALHFALRAEDPYFCAGDLAGLMNEIMQGSALSS